MNKLISSLNKKFKMSVKYLLDELANTSIDGIESLYVQRYHVDVTRAIMMEHRIQRLECWDN